jgi:hypothetical protein
MVILGQMCKETNLFALFSSFVYPLSNGRHTLTQLTLLLHSFQACKIQVPLVSELRPHSNVISVHVSQGTTPLGRTWMKTHRQTRQGL